MASKDQNPKWAAHQQLRAKRSEVVEAPNSTPKTVKIERVQIPVELVEVPAEVKIEVPVEVVDETAIPEEIVQPEVEETIEEKVELKPISKKKNKA